MKIEKISFCSLNGEEISELVSRLSSDEAQLAREAMEYYSSVCEDQEVAFSLCGGALLVRVFDYGRYFFLFPIPLSDGADVSEAVEQTVRYCYLEEIEPVFSGVLQEEISVFLSLGYRHINLDADSAESELYRVTLKNELSLIDSLPGVSGESLSLEPLSEKDASAYLRLSLDEETNRFMGYDLREDYPDADENTLLEIISRELAYCSAVTFAVRDGADTVGDAALHNFDYKGGADISLRILPEQRGKGYATIALDLLLEASRKMGLTHLYARVHRDNIPSHALFSKKASSEEDEGYATVYRYDLV